MIIEEIEKKKNECRALTQSMEEGNFDAFVVRKFLVIAIGEEFKGTLGQMIMGNTKSMFIE